MAEHATLENLADDVALLRQELHAVLETLVRLDNQTAQLEQRLIAIRDENQDVAAGLRNLRREILALNRATGARLDRLEQPAPSTPILSGTGGA